MAAVRTRFLYAPAVPLTIELLRQIGTAGMRARRRLPAGGARRRRRALPDVPRRSGSERVVPSAANASTKFVRQKRVGRPAPRLPTGLAPQLLEPKGTIMNATITPNQIHELLQPQVGPCLSVYLATHRRHPENQQDPIRYKNLVKQLETTLSTHYPNANAASLLAPFLALTHEAPFWTHSWDGLAVLGNAAGFRTIKLQRPVPAVATVATSFHLKPLLRIHQ